MFRESEKPGAGSKKKFRVGDAALPANDHRLPGAHPFGGTLGVQPRLGVAVGSATDAPQRRNARPTRAIGSRYVAVGGDSFKHFFGGMLRLAATDCVERRLRNYGGRPKKRSGKGLPRERRIPRSWDETEWRARRKPFGASKGFRRLSAASICGWPSHPRRVYSGSFTTGDRDFAWARVKA